jgi:hypothetical protein
MSPLARCFIHPKCSCTNKCVKYALGTPSVRDFEPSVERLGGHGMSLISRTAFMEKRGEQRHDAPDDSAHVTPDAPPGHSTMRLRGSYADQASSSRPVHGQVKSTAENDPSLKAVPRNREISTHPSQATASNTTATTSAVSVPLPFSLPHSLEVANLPSGQQSEALPLQFHPSAVDPGTKQIAPNRQSQRFARSTTPSLRFPHPLITQQLENVKKHHGGSEKPAKVLMNASESDRAVFSATPRSISSLPPGGTAVIPSPTSGKLLLVIAAALPIFSITTIR